MGMENPNLSTLINIIMVHFFPVQKCQSKLTICHASLVKSTPKIVICHQ